MEQACTGVTAPPKGTITRKIKFGIIQSKQRKVVTMAASQVLHPTRAVLRTVFAAVLSFAALFPTIVDAAHLPQWSGIAIAVAAAGGVTRIFALPQVEIFLQQFIPWLSAAPAAPETVVPDNTDSTDAQ